MEHLGSLAYQAQRIAHMCTTTLLILVLLKDITIGMLQGIGEKVTKRTNQFCRYYNYIIAGDNMCIYSVISFIAKFFFLSFSSCLFFF